jgi:hypothetical protein
MSQEYNFVRVGAVAATGDTADKLERPGLPLRLVDRYHSHQMNYLSLATPTDCCLFPPFA